MTLVSAERSSKPKQFNEKLSQFVRHIKKSEPYYNAYRTQLLLESKDVQKTMNLAGKSIEFLQQQLEQLEQENALLQQENDALKTENDLLADELSKSTVGQIQVSRSKFSGYHQSNAEVFNKIMSIKREISQISAVLKQIKDNMLRNQDVFQQFVSQLSAYVESQFLHRQTQIQESALNLSLLKTQKAIDMIRRTDYCFPTKQQYQQMQKSFTDKETQYLSQNFTHEDIALFAAQIFAKLECTAQELVQNWTKDVELFVKDELIAEFGISNDMHISRSRTGLYETDERDDLVTCWLMTQLFSSLGQEGGVWE